MNRQLRKQITLTSLFYVCLSSLFLASRGPLKRDKVRQRRKRDPECLERWICMYWWILFWWDFVLSPLTFLRRSVDFILIENRLSTSIVSVRIFSGRFVCACLMWWLVQAQCSVEWSIYIHTQTTQTLTVFFIDALDSGQCPNSLSLSLSLSVWERSMYEHCIFTHKKQLYSYDRIYKQIKYRRNEISINRNSKAR